MNDFEILQLVPCDGVFYVHYELYELNESTCQITIKTVSTRVVLFALVKHNGRTFVHPMVLWDGAIVPFGTTYGGYTIKREM